MEFRVLGPLEVVAESGPLSLGGPRLRALLAILLTRANQVVSRDRLINELFGEEPREAARNLVQVYVSRLRKALEPGRSQTGPGSFIVTRPPGYLIRLERDQLDLRRFERLAEEARRALLAGAPEIASGKLGDALALWRGPALAEFAFEPFAQTEIARLEELRLAALEDHIEADIALGRHAAVVGELEALIPEHPLRERLRGQLMLALYRSGRQAEALALYQETRKVLVDDLGIEPTTALQELEKAILRQDPSLDLAPRSGGAGGLVSSIGLPRSLVVMPGVAEGDLAALLALVEPLARGQPPRELVLARLVADPSELKRAAQDLSVCRDVLAARQVVGRAAVFVSADRGDDAVRLVSEQEAELLVIDAHAFPIGSAELASVLAEAPCDVALLARSPDDRTAPDADHHRVVVPFGGLEHDWAALELGAWLASAHRAPLAIVGSVGDPEAGKRDASRLLARASLIVQRFADVTAEPILTPPGPEGVLGATAGSGVLVVGLSNRWRDEGLGSARERIAAESEVPVLFARRGVRPGGLTPPEGLTRFTWSLAGQASS